MASSRNKAYESDFEGDFNRELDNAPELMQEAVV